jgi:NAD(P)-dependent dehydrogenase (short-subunit alcohol dehydrogenase family)
MNDIAFTGRTILITGGGRGLGAAYAQLLAARGANVFVNDIDDEAANAVAHEIDGEPVPGDVSSEHGAVAVMERVLDRSGVCDAVIANAGTSWHRMFGELSAAEIDEALRHNLLSTIHIVRAAWPHFLEQHFGRIVTTSSGGIFGIAGRAHYGAAKGGVLALTRTLAIEGRDHGITVNCVLPWGLTRLARPGSPAPPPHDAAAAVAWLCHDDCDVTGAAFTVGGGKVGWVRFDAQRPVAVDPRDIRAHGDAMRALSVGDHGGLGSEAAAQRNLRDEREDDRGDDEHRDHHAH